MKQKCLFLTIISLMITACGTTKKVTQTPVAPPPSWVAARPTSTAYYIGIGSARKTADANQYMQAAKQNALADLSSDISISISSNSVLSAFETNLKMSEDFSSTIRTETQKDLEGYEVVETWENPTHYWVYYRLSKAEYQRIVDERKGRATTKSLDYFGKSQTNLREGDTRQAIVNLIKALEPIKPYFSDPLPVHYQGREIYLGNEIFQSLSSTIGSLGIAGDKPQLSVKLGQSIQPDQLTFKVSDANGRPLNGIPVAATYTEKPLRNSRVRTDIRGEASYLVDAIRSNRSIETFKVAIALEDMVNEATADYLIRRLVARFPAPEAVVVINIVKPVFFIASDEKNIGKPLAAMPLREAMKRKLLEAGLPVADREKDADYLVLITAATQAKGESGSYKHSALSGVVVVKDAKGAEVYLKPFDGITGSHFDHEAAGNEAIKEATKKIEGSIAREIIEGLVKGKVGY